LSDEELNEFSLSLHTHELQRVLFLQLNHSVQRDEHLDVIFSVVCESELLFVPVGLNDLEFLLDLGFFLGNIHDFVDWSFEFVEVEA